MNILSSTIHFFLKINFQLIHVQKQFFYISGVLMQTKSKKIIRIDYLTTVYIYLYRIF